MEKTLKSSMTMIELSRSMKLIRATIVLQILMRRKICPTQRISRNSIMLRKVLIIVLTSRFKLLIKNRFTEN
jgi:hypothetical protein